ncbi:branched-chain amino acid ABC transporter permease [Thermus caliditerrae]|uniref:branched-chain amino acid ABC transporter permease n=1 Tax=Thermus caliditerrae TaxID=1330700 RepID=UPI000571CE34|nr:branched-chain amino acid ABC transporter permease [Thermus caliditerrae]
MEFLLQTLLNGLLMSGVYALVATGLALSLGVVGIVNFAHGEFLMMGAFLSYLFFALQGLDPLFSLGLAFLAAFLVGGLVYQGLIRPVLPAPELNQMLLTFGLSILLQNLALLLFGADTRVVAPSYQAATLTLGPFFLGAVPLGAFMLSLGLLFLLQVFLTRSRLGLAMRAVAQNRLAPGLLGIEADQVYLLAFGLAAALAGVAGVMLSVILYASPTVGFIFTLKSFAIVALAGLGNLKGVVPAALVLALAEALVSTYLPGGGGLVEAVFFLVLFLALVGRAWRSP